jgi:transposase
MAKRVEVQTELTAEELHERYRKAREPVERTHWQILWLMKEGHTPGEVAERVGYTARWVRTIVGRYNRHGTQAISNHRLTLPGAKPGLPREQQQELEEALQQRPDDDGLWSGPKVASWMQDKLGRPVDARRGWDYMQRLSYSTHVPRPKHAQADEAAQQALKTTARGGRTASSDTSASKGRTVERR